MQVFEEYEAYWTRLNVSRETVTRLEGFVSLLLERQKRVNLMSRGETQDIWVRHVIDSAQLSLYISEVEKKLADFGSGNGFPGIILSILNPQMKVLLIEKLEKKASFLAEVVKSMGLKAEVLKTPFSKLAPIHAQVLCARAVAPLGSLLEQLAPFLNRTNRLVLPKGKLWKEEVDDALKSWRFSYKAHVSLTSPEARVLVIREVARK